MKKSLFLFFPGDRLDVSWASSITAPTFVLGRWLNMHEPSLDSPVLQGVRGAEVIFSGFAPLWERSCEESGESLCGFFLSFLFLFSIPSVLKQYLVQLCLMFIAAREAAAIRNTL